MIVQGRVVTARRACRICRTAAGSRYSSWYFIRPPVVQFLQFVHPCEEGKDLLRLRFVDDRQGEADVHHHVHAGPGLGNVLQADALADAAEIDLAHPQVMLDVRFDDSSGDSETHRLTPFANSKFEIRNPKQIQRSKSKAQNSH